MGLRGPGARPRKSEAPRAPTKRAKKQPWEKKGLKRWQRVVAFLESLPITKGMLEGQPMELLPNQRKFVKEVYGRLDKKGRRIVRIAILSEPAGNGKTGFIAGLQLCHLLGPEAETRGECDAAAVDRTQSSKMFDEIEAIIAEVPDFASRVNIKAHEKKIVVLDGPGKGSVFSAMSGDARKGHGLAPSFWSYDELAQVSDRALLDNLISRMGKRDEALGVIISTQAATDDHPLSQEIDRGLPGKEPSLHVSLVATPEDEKNIFSEKTLKKVNEAWGKFLNPVDVMNDARRAKDLPAWEPKFRNERHNQRTATSSALRPCTKKVWDLGHVIVDPAKLRGRECYGGLDLSGKHDLTAFVLVFPDEEVDTGYDILPFFWTPEGQLASRKPRERDQFEQWIRDKVLNPVPGPVIKYSFVATQLAELNAQYDIKAVAYDSWNIDRFRQDCEDVGCELPLVPFVQGVKSFSPAIDAFSEIALSGLLRHGGHPVLTASMAATMYVRDAAGNQKPDKDKSNRAATTRIDGFVALLMAILIATRAEAEDTGKSFWETPAA